MCDNILKIISACFVIAGTYILSRGVFEQSVKRQINLEFKDLPWYFKLVIFCFGYKNAYINKTLWGIKAYPSGEKLSFKDGLREIIPFLGFVFVCLGTFLALFIN